MKVLFMGTPEIAATALGALVADGFTVVGAVCQPDRPKGRGMVMTPPAVKVEAQRHGIPVYQPQTLKDGAFLPTLSSLSPDVIAVVAYGKILPREILSFPKYGCVNLHVSLLPKYRGAAPMQRAIMAGERETGVTTMLMDEGLDTGDILLSEAFPIGKEDNFEAVHDTSAAIGGQLLCRTLRALGEGVLTPRKQDHAAATYADKITKEDCLLDFSLPAVTLDARIRGLSPIPLAFTRLKDGKILKICSASPKEGKGRCGEVIGIEREGVLVACGEGALLLRTVLPEGKGKMSSADLARGRAIALGDILGQ